MESHLLQMRGLKLLGPIDAKSAPLVASFTDAWIETVLNTEWRQKGRVASFTDAWIETASRVSCLRPQWCRIFYRCVD